MAALTVMIVASVTARKAKINAEEAEKGNRNDPWLGLGAATSKPAATAARFDEAEPAATNSTATSKAI